MAPTPFGFFEMEDKVLSPDAAQFSKAQLGEAPEAFDAVDVIPAARELVLVMVDAVMLVATQNKAVIGLPAVGVHMASESTRPLMIWLKYHTSRGIHQYARSRPLFTDEAAPVGAMEFRWAHCSSAPPGRIRDGGRSPVVPARGLASPPANFRGASGTSLHTPLSSIPAFHQ